MLWSLVRVVEARLLRELFAGEEGFIVSVEVVHLKMRMVDKIYNLKIKSSFLPLTLSMSPTLSKEIQLGRNWLPKVVIEDS